jgi:hypothetical protein
MPDGEIQEAVISHAQADLSAMPEAPSMGGQSMLGKVMEAVGDVASWAFDEALMPAAEKLIPQGAAELSQALFNGSAYVPYGPTEAAMPIEAAAPSLDAEIEAAARGGGVHGQDSAMER